MKPARRSVCLGTPLVVLLLGFTSPVAAQVPPLLQVDVTASLPPEGKATARFESSLARSLDPPEQGPAKLTGLVRSRGGGAVIVNLAFHYKVPRDTMASAALIERIEITTETPEGEEGEVGEVFLASTIDTQRIRLEPNRVPLFYRATLYRPGTGDRTVVRVRVFGNYE